MKSKRNIIVGISLVILFIGTSCKTKSSSADVHASPENVLNAVFEAANTQNFNMLSDLSDPLGENDGDTRDICNLTKEMEEEFIRYFKKGTITGDAIVTGDEAEVPFTFGPDGSQAVTMKCVMRDGEWYLYSF